MIKTLLAVVTAFSFLLFPLASARADQVHRVSPGETLYTIAKEKNVSLKKIMSKNPFIENPDYIVPYQVVVLPDPKPGARYTVNPGDTLETVAADHRVDPVALAAYNELEKTSLYPGQVLIIPPAPKEPSKPPGPSQPGSPPPKKPAYRYNIPELRAQFPDSLFLSGNRDKKVVALTFDDGPDDNYTPRVLDILNRQGVKATFFLVGSRVKEYPSVVSQLVESGHQVAWHGWTHTNFRLKSVEEVRREMANTASAFKETINLDPVMFRPPFGELSLEALKELADSGHTAVGWNADSLDWRSIPVDLVLANALVNTRPGSIIVMHSAGTILEGTVKALPELIYTLKAQGYGFVTVADLLDKPAYRQ